MTHGKAKGNEEKSYTFGREDTLFVMSTVYEMNIEILGYGVNSWDLVCPSAI